ncbi:MSHA biogenesis protein MshF [Shewanella sp. YIC-542]|uniref:MSHA biogenesis protein MshF n=1 Tax=Shewanella mytili TaxID=3377111 RepID=UPI00398E4580
MTPQRRADTALMSVYQQLVALVLLLLLLGIIGARYFNGLQQVTDNTLQVEHNRLLNVLAMVRSQWLSQGSPASLSADWQLSQARSEQDVLKMAQGGWPLPASYGATGCQQLWQQLLGVPLQSLGISVRYQADTSTCEYHNRTGQYISYQLSSGRVMFLTENVQH